MVSVIGAQEKLFHLLSTKNQCKLKPHRLISNFILSEYNLHFSKKEENGINMIDATLSKLCYQRKYLLEDYVPVQNTLRRPHVKGYFAENMLLAIFHQMKKNLQ